MKAIIRLKEGITTEGFGIGIQDSRGNNYSIPISRREIELPEHVAKDFEGHDLVDVIYADGKQPEVKLKPVEHAEEVPKILTKTEAKDLSKAQQTALLKRLGAKSIPRYERGRVSLILQLQ